MADRGRRLPDYVVARLRRLCAAVGIKPAARELHLSKNTVKKHFRNSLKSRLEV